MPTYEVDFDQKCFRTASVLVVAADEDAAAEQAREILAADPDRAVYSEVVEDDGYPDHLETRFVSERE